MSQTRQSASMHLGILSMRALGALPLLVIRAVGWLLGYVLYATARRRRRIVLINLRLCLPELNERQRRALARRNCVCFAQAALDRAWVWHASPDVVRRRLRLTGAIEDLTRPGAVVIFAPHFYGMDAGGSAIMQQVARAGSLLYATQPNPALDAWMREGRARFGDVTPIARAAGPKPVLRALREGRMLYLLPDMDLGPRESVFVPFFGVNTATVPSLARFAKLGHARVVPVVTRMTRQGYEAHVHPAWDHYPSDDPVADTARMNRELEGYIRAMPEQYYWVHRRFKTRP
ncbi:MAG: lipid A biosynthesis acyltransferase, partial [Burkholderiaceae bacterium]|nr:lipid A biosynthesis acyltransferase [Burkholderiaceae bacterium]